MKSAGWEHPVSWAIGAMVIFAAVFEPVRQVLLHGQSTISVGGVGGVGGLANLGPSNDDCFEQYRGRYCYTNGDFGPFMWFAVATLICWIGPLFLAFLLTALKGSCRSNDDRSISAQPNIPPAASMTWTVPVWIGLNFLWFVFPWMSFALGLKEVEGPFARQVLALALGASHPLSWNLSFVVIPTGGPLTELMMIDGNDNEDSGNSETSLKSLWFPFHRLLGYTTAFWGVLHGVGEIVYLLSTRERMQSFLRLRTDGETLLYWAGLVTLLLLVAHSAGAYFRRSNWWDKQTVSFQLLHRYTAGALLLVASAHWWPFALFFVPATTIHGVTAARNHSLGHLELPRKQHRTRQTILALQLAFSLLASLGGVVLVWSLRQDYMQGSTANLYWPFFFPPMCVVISTVASYLAARGLLWAVSLLSSEELRHERMVSFLEIGSPRPEIDPLLPNHA